MIDEHLLIDRARNGDTMAFRELVERSKHMVVQLAYGLTGNMHDAEDLSQDVFVKAYRSLPKFRGDAKWSTWIYRITVNTCMDHGRSKAGKGKEVQLGEQENGWVPPPAEKGIGPERSAASSIMQQHIERALDALSPQERSVFVLRHYHDLPLKQIAKTLELAEGTVKSYLFRAVQRLQKDLSFYRREMGMGESV